MLTAGPFRPAADLASLYRHAEPWLVPGIIPKNGLVILASAPKTGKTCFATYLARCVAKGELARASPCSGAPGTGCALMTELG